MAQSHNCLGDRNKDSAGRTGPTCRSQRQSARSTALVLLQTNVFELGPHRFSGVQLQSQNAFFQRQVRIVVGEVEDQAAVHVVLHVVAFGDDDDFVPFIDIEQLFVLVGGNQCFVDDFLFFRFPAGFFADQADTAAPATFVERFNVEAYFDFLAR